MEDVTVILIYGAAHFVEVLDDLQVVHELNLLLFIIDIQTQNDLANVAFLVRHQFIGYWDVHLRYLWNEPEFLLGNETHQGGPSLFIRLVDVHSQVNQVLQIIVLIQAIEEEVSVLVSSQVLFQTELHEVFQEGKQALLDELDPDVGTFAIFVFENLIFLLRGREMELDQN